MNRLENHQSGGLEIGRDVNQTPSQALMIKKAASEAPPLGGVRHGGSEGGFNERARHCRDMRACGGDALQGSLERLTWRSKEIAVGDLYAIKANAGCADRRPSDQSARRQPFDPRRVEDQR